MNTIPCTVLGATGAVGRRFTQLLDAHPRFELVKLCASPGSAGQRYGEYMVRSGGTVPDRFRDVELSLPEPGSEVTPLVFSALDAGIATEIEESYARAGALVVSNASSHRMDPLVPLVVPEVNAAHLELLARQRKLRAYPGVGGILTNPNCSTIGLALALAPLMDFEPTRAHVVSMQALSGAGSKAPTLAQMADNLVPYIGGEEQKLATETGKIFGSLGREGVIDAQLALSAQCNRVAVVDGHTACVSLELKERASAAELIERWQSFRALPQELGLPSAPQHPTLYHDALDAPQPRLHRDLERGMATSIGRLQPCCVLDWRFVCLSHNTLRGAAGGALLLAELAHAQGFLDI